MTEELLAQQQELARVRKEITEAKEARRVRARRGLGHFMEYTLRDEKSYELIKLHDIHWMWIEFICICWNRGLIPFILAPWGAGKTSFLIGLILFLIGHDPGLRMKIISANDDLASDRLVLVRQYIEDSAEYHDLFPDVRRYPGKSWGMKKLTCYRPGPAKDATLQAIGITSTAIGARSDFIAFDDQNDLRNTVLQPKLRGVAWKNFKLAVSRLEPDFGRAVVIMTRWHNEDVFGQVTRDPVMMQRYGFLIQGITNELDGLDCEIILGHGETEAEIKQSPLDRLMTLHTSGRLAQKVLAG